MFPSFPWNDGDMLLVIRNIFLNPLYPLKRDAKLGFPPKRAPSPPRGGTRRPQPGARPNKVFFLGKKKLVPDTRGTVRHATLAREAYPGMLMLEADPKHIRFRTNQELFPAGASKTTGQDSFFPEIADQGFVSPPSLLT